MRRRPFLLFLAVLVIALPALAQRITGTIRGTVTDPAGNPAASIEVEVLNSETGFSRKTPTNAAGAYSFADLPVGTYVLNIEAQGFKSVLVQNIVVSVADVRAINVQLELGEIEDEVTVTSSSIVVETTSGEVAGLVTGEQVRELPLNGRNFIQLTQLMPGVSAPDGLNTKNKGLLTGSDLSVSGGNTTGNLWTVDGANNNDVGSNRTILVYPSVDAIEEFKIHRNSYGAEFGGAGGAQINLVTRGGTNDFHGSAYYFRRDDAYNEANYFLRQAGQGQKEPLSRDDFGYTIGGPIVKDKLHFFISQEWNDEQRGVVRSGFVPTAAQRSGDFSTVVPGCAFGNEVPIDPLTGAPFPGNVIPSDRLSQAGLLYLQLFPLPNASISGSCTNWVEPVNTPIEWNQINARMDWSVTPSARVLLRYTEDSWENGAPNAGDSNGLWGDDPFPAADSTWDQPSRSLVGQLNQVIGSSAVNTVTISQTGNSINIIPGGDLGLTGQINAAIPTLFPASGKTGDTVSHPVFWGGGGLPTLWNIAPWENDHDLLVFKEDFQKVFGRHEMRAGVLYGQYEKKEVCCGSASNEAVQIWGGFPGNGAGLAPWGFNTTGNGAADFLLDGMYFGFAERSRIPDPNVKWEDLEVYIADTWQARPNLTFDFGVRWSRYKWPYAEDNNINSFVPEAFDPALGNDPCNGILQAPGTDFCGDAGFAGGQGPGRGLVAEDDDNFAPRLGMAWDIFGNGKHVLRAGFGQFFQRERVNIQLDFAQNAPFSEFTSGIRTLDGSSVFTDGFNFGLPSRGIDPNAEVPYNLQFNLTWEQRIGRDSTLELSYVGNRGRHLMRPRDINQVPAGDPNGNGVPDRLEFVRCGDNAGCRAALRPFGVFGDNTILYWQTDGNSEYDSLQAQFITRYGQGSQFQASLTLANFDADTDVGASGAGTQAGQVTDLDNLGLDFGPATLHRDLIFNASVVHNLPSFENKGGIFQHLFGDWTLGAIVLYNSGTPLTIAAGGPVNGVGASGTGFNDNQRPIRVPGVSCDGGGGTQILNPAAFTLTGFQLGETSQMAGRGSCEGPDFFQVDLSFAKNVQLTDRFDLQFRIEAFNLFNSNNFVGVNTFWTGATTLDAPVGSATTIVDSSPNPSFGQAFGARDPRQFQFGIKLIF